jgi:hypothetical protein
VGHWGLAPGLTGAQEAVERWRDGGEGCVEGALSAGSLGARREGKEGRAGWTGKGIGWPVVGHHYWPSGSVARGNRGVEWGVKRGECGVVSRRGGNIGAVRALEVTVFGRFHPEEEESRARPKRQRGRTGEGWVGWLKDTRPAGQWAGARERGGGPQLGRKPKMGQSSKRNSFRISIDFRIWQNFGKLLKEI